MTLSSNDFEMKTLPNGKKNPKYVDLMDEDSPIPGQKFACVSFISPETVLKKRETFLFEQFVKQWEMSKSMEKFSDFVNFVSFKYHLTPESVMQDFQEFVTEEETKLKESSTMVEDDYKNFLDKNEERLTQVFSKENKFQTSVRGLKIRGSFASQEEAEMNCKKIRDRDPSHDIYVAPVGLWLPWEPVYYKVGKVEYLEPELNRLHEEKIKNESHAKNEFDKRIKDAKRKAIEENVRKARASGNKLTQTLDSDGNLVGANTINYDEREVADDEGRKIREDEVISNSKLEKKDTETKPEPEPETETETKTENTKKQQKSKNSKKPKN
jgi:hypothetical protein